MKTRAQEQVEKMIRMLTTGRLSKSHPKYSLQEKFIDFAATLPLSVRLVTDDFFNDGEMVSVHFESDAFIITIDTDRKIMESAILLDYDNCLFDTFETTSFTWDKLHERVMLFEDYKYWQSSLAKTKTIKILKEKLNIGD